MTNYDQLGERLLAPHVGLEYPDHRELGGDSTWACEVEASSVVIGLEDGNTNQRNYHEALPPGANPLVTKSANPKAMLDLVKGDYNQELHSSRLQGNAVKEALAIILFLQFCRTTLTNQSPAWMPNELLSLGEELLQTRLTFLTASASKPTHKEKKGQVMTLHPGLNNSKLKRKLLSAGGEENTRRPAKQQKVFTTTPEEMVKIFGQYMQAQGASYGRRVQPARFMEFIIERVELFRHREQGTVAELPSPVPAQPLMNLVIEDQAHQPSVEAIPRVDSSPHPAINPMFASPQPDQSKTRGGGGRGGAREWRGHGGQGADSRRGHAGRNWQAERPVRCPNGAPPGSFCSYPNFPEAETCGGQ
jgi:hypothetical protein